MSVELPGQSTVEQLFQRAQAMGPERDSARFLLHTLVDAAEEYGPPYYEIQAHYLLGKHYLLKLRTADAKRHFRNAARLAGMHREYELQGFALDRLGITLLEERMLDSALLAFQHALEIYNTNHFEFRSWASLQGISRVFGNRGDYALARKYGEQALSSASEMSDPIARSVVLNHMVTVSRDHNQLEDFAHYLDLYVETIEPIKSSTNSEHKIAFYVLKENPQERLSDIRSVIDALGPTPRISTISSYYHLGKTYMELEDWTSAIASFREGLSLNGQVPNSIAFRHALYSGLIDACVAKGDYQCAFEWSQQRAGSEDSIAHAVNNTLINELQVKYETAQKEQTILAQELALERGMRQRNLILLAVILLTGLGLVLFFAQRRKMQLQRTIARQESSLQRQHILDLENQNKLLSLSAMIAGQEEERKRLAKDIHDGLGGLLAMVKIQFDRMGEMLGDTKAKAEFERSRKLLDETGNEVRRIAHNMMPHALMKMGLIPALEDLAANIQTANGLRVSLKCIEVSSQLAAEKEIVLYRITQELCNNVIKHANADKLLIQLSQYNGTCSLVVEDNGRGFTHTEQKNGMGMESVASRVAYLNGSLEIDSHSGKGTSVSIEFPIEHSLTIDLHKK